MTYKKIRIVVCDGCGSEVSARHYLQAKTNHTHKTIHACNHGCANKYEQRLTVKHNWVWI